MEPEGIELATRALALGFSMTGTKRLIIKSPPPLSPAGPLALTGGLRVGRLVKFKFLFLLFLLLLADVPDDPASKSPQR